MSFAEFADDVSWQLQPWASLNDATGFHLGEGRWSRDRRFAQDYLTFMYNGGNDRHFTDYMADSAWGVYLVDGDQASVTAHLNSMTNIYKQWDDHLDTSKGLYWVEPLLDATEYTISSIDASGGKDGFAGGQAFRPSVNAYQYANARAIANIAKLAGRENLVSEYNGLADGLKARLQSDIWNTTLQHFIDRHQSTNEFVKYYEPIRGRELVGIVPWTFNMPDDNTQYSEAFKHFFDTNALAGEAGLRTVEPSYEYYMRQYRYDSPTGRRECQWNGPIWPFQTTQALLAMSNVLDHYKEHGALNVGNYLSTLRSYAKLHYKGNTLNLEEDYEPDTGNAIVGLSRSPHYFHSGFIDLIMSGYVGIRPRADDVLEVNPLVDDSVAWFRAEEVPYHGHNVAVQWDANGSKYGRKGLLVEVDGQEVAFSENLGRLTANVARKPVVTIDRPIARSIQLQEGMGPSATVSSGNDGAAVHDAIDGRVWFFPELPHGWVPDSTPQDSEQWITINLGDAGVDISRAELAFFTDDQTYFLPKDYTLLDLVNGQFQKIEGNGEQLVSNGITNVNWSSRKSTQIRLSFTQPANQKVRLVEFKLF